MKKKNATATEVLPQTKGQKGKVRKAAPQETYEYFKKRFAELK